MKKFLASLVLLMGTLLSANVYSMDNCYQDCALYAGLLGGPNWLDINPQHNVKLNSKTGYLVGGVVGYRFNQPYRVEAEVSFRRNSYYLANGLLVNKKFEGHENTWAFMGNAYYDLNCHPVIRPYVGVGLGYATVRHNTHFSSFEEGYSNAYSHKFNENGFAYQLMAGVNYRICENVDVGAEYRYFSIANKKMDDNSLAFTIKHYF